MKISELQEKIGVLFKNIAHPRIGAYIGLTEEVGELGKEIMEKEIYGADIDKEKIAAEAADIIFSTVELCNLYGIDIQTELLKKLNKISAKIPDWEKKYSEILKRKRERFD